MRALGRRALILNVLPGFSSAVRPRRKELENNPGAGLSTGHPPLIARG